MLRWRRVTISGGFLLLAAALYYLDGQGVVPWALLACLCHELGHYVAIRAFGGRVAQLRLTCAGAEMALSARRPLSRAGQLCTALAGPGTNLALAALSARLAGPVGESAYLFAGLNLALALFNLLPAAQLDGGRALAVLLSLVLPEDRAERGMRVLSLGLGLALTAAGAALALRAGGSLTLLITALWLLASSLPPLRGGGPGRTPKSRTKRRIKKFSLHSGASYGRIP